METTYLIAYHVKGFWEVYNSWNLDNLIEKAMSEKGILIGRNPQCEINIPLKFMSKVHGKICYKNGNFKYYNISENGSGCTEQRADKINLPGAEVHDEIGKTFNPRLYIVIPYKASKERILLKLSKEDVKKGYIPEAEIDLEDTIIEIPEKISLKLK
jgi:hypothetical protein